MNVSRSTRGGAGATKLCTHRLYVAQYVIHCMSITPYNLKCRMKLSIIIQLGGGHLHVHDVQENPNQARSMAAYTLLISRTSISSECLHVRHLCNFPAIRAHCHQPTRRELTSGRERGRGSEAKRKSKKSSGHASWLAMSCR